MLVRLVDVYVEDTGLAIHGAVCNRYQVDYEVQRYLCGTSIRRDTVTMILTTVRMDTSRTDHLAPKIIIIEIQNALPKFQKVEKSVAMRRQAAERLFHHELGCSFSTFHH